MISRRGLFRAAGGAGLALAAPAIIRTAGLLMPIKPLVVVAGPLILWPQVGYPIVAWQGQSKWVGVVDEYLEPFDIRPLLNSLNRRELPQWPARLVRR